MSTPATWLSSSVAWLDSKGKGAWLLTMILGFIFIWPLGLAVLFYMIWSNRMSSSFFSCSKSSARALAPTGNSAFDAYKEDTLKRLEDEQGAFQNFLQRLRDAKDKTEFDNFMEEREKVAKATA